MFYVGGYNKTSKIRSNKAMYEKIDSIGIFNVKVLSKANKMKQKCQYVYHKGT